MKCSLLMEAKDVQDMLMHYFASLGFKTSELASVAEKFSTAFPEGLTVEVEPLPQVSAPSAWVTPPAPPPVPYTITTTAVPPDENPVLTYTELMDEPDDIASVIRESEALKKSR